MKILFVDDDPLILKKLEYILDWASLGINEIFFSNNGQEAFSVIKNKQPDLVISDINMPQMDGIELVEACTFKFPKTNFIMLTINDSFSYAQRALNNGVFNYILKPIEKKKLLDVVLQVIAKIKNQENNTNYLKELEHDSKIAKTIQKEQFLNRLIAGGNTFSEDEIHSFFKKYKINLTGDWFQVISIHMNDFELIKGSFDEFDDLLSELIEEIRDALFQYNNYTIFIDQFYNIILLKSYYEKQNISHEDKLISTIIRNRLINSHNIKTTIFLSNKYKSAQNIYRCYYDTRYLPEYTLEVMEKGVVSIAELITNSQFNKNKINNIRSEVLKYLRLSQKSKLNTYVYQIIHNLTPVRENLDSFNLIKIEFIMTGLMFLQETKSNPETIFGTDFNALSLIFEKYSLSAAVEEICRFYSRIIDYLNDNKIQTNQLLIEKCYELIDNNIANTDLSVKWLSEQLYINTSYLSVQFKKETGVTLIKHISKQKLLLAKKLMDEGNSNLYYISQEVGFNDQLYFSKCFKKEYGISPSAYLGNLK